MRYALGMALLSAVSIVGLIAAFEWLVAKIEPTDQQRESMRTHWLLLNSGVVREREK